MGNAPQNHKVVSVEDTELSPDAYGNRYYSIKIEGFDGPLLWKTKQRPDLGPVFGHTEPSKTGKSMLFKRDKQDDVPYNPDAKPTPTFDPSLKAPISHPNSSYVESPDKQQNIIWSICVKEAATFVGSHNEDMDEVKFAELVSKFANAMFITCSKPKDITDTARAILQQDVVLDTVDDKPIDLSEIPF